MPRRGLAQRRKDVGLSQERLAEVLGVDRSTVVRWERAETSPQPWHRPRLADALGISVEELADLLSVVAGAKQSATPPGVPRQSSSDGDDLDIVRSLRQADRRLGGAHLYATVTDYLQRHVAPRVFGYARNDGRHEVFAVAAGLTEMAGWMAHDAGVDDLAERHFQHALGFAVAGRDSQLGAHVCGSLSHLSLHANRPDRALEYAKQGQGWLRSGPPHAGLAAKLLALQARGYAAIDNRAGCLDHIRYAERALGGGSAAVSVWVSGFDEASLALEAARCLSLIGQHGAARVEAEQVIAVRPYDRARSRALAQLVLAGTLVAQARPDEACAIASDALRSTRALGSAVVMRQLEHVGRRLMPFLPNSDVAAFLEVLHGELRERRWLARWVPGQEPASGRPE
jgi:transcriptional regulator with XRE-family HTH domain